MHKRLMKTFKTWTKLLLWWQCPCPARLISFSHSSSTQAVQNKQSQNSSWQQCDECIQKLAPVLRLQLNDCRGKKHKEESTNVQICHLLTNSVSFLWWPQHWRQFWKQVSNRNKYKYSTNIVLSMKHDWCEVTLQKVKLFYGQFVRRSESWVLISEALLEIQTTLPPSV